MLLTKKSCKKIAIHVMETIFVCILWLILFGFPESVVLWAIFGSAVVILCLAVVIVGVYTDGAIQWSALGKRLLRHELKPKEFIRWYENLKASGELVIHRPSAGFLEMLACAYEISGDREHALTIYDEMIAAASKKYKPIARLLKASALFCCGRSEEAETLLQEVRKQAPDDTGSKLMETVLKYSRAMAMGDYETVEAFALQRLVQTSPPLDNLGVLACHYDLGTIYEMLDEREKAIPHYRYCVEFCGETVFGENAKAALERL